MEAMYNLRTPVPTLVITGFRSSSHDLQVLAHKLNYHYREEEPSSASIFLTKWDQLYFVLAGSTPRSIIDPLHKALLACCEPADLVLYDENFDLIRRLQPCKYRKYQRAG